MRRNGLMPMGLALAVMMGCAGSGAPTDPSQERSAIDRTRNAYASAWKAGNAVVLTDLYADNALVLYPNQPALAGKPAILTYFDQFFAEFEQNEFELSSSEIEVAGSWAFDRGEYRWKVMPRSGGEAVEDHGKYLVILQRQPDGSWRVARDMDNSDRPLAQSTRGPG